MKSICKNCSILLVMYYYEKILGLCPFTLNNGNVFQPSKIGKTYSVILSILYAACCFATIFYRFNIRFPDENQLKVLIDIFGIIFKSSAVIALWLSPVFFQKKLQIIFDRLGFVSKNEESLFERETNNAPRHACKKIKRYFIMVNLLFYILVLAENFLRREYKVFLSQANFWIAYNVPHAVIYNALFVFIEVMAFLRKKFKNMNKYLIKICKKTHYETTMISQKLKTIGCFHENLTDIIENFSDLFSLSILLVMITTFIQMVDDFYSIYCFSKSRDEWQLIDIGSFISTLSLFAFKISFLYFICGVSDAACEQVNDFLFVFHK